MESQLPQLSVLMPVRNGSRYLATAIQTTLRALPRDAELLIANDGSTDDTQRIIGRFEDKRLRSVEWDTSQGVSASLNYLIANSDSELVARMDADDICLPYRFRYQASILGDVDCLFSSVLFINSKGFLLRPELPGRIGSKALSVHLLMGNVLVHPTMFGRRTFIESLGGYRATPAEDYDMWLRGASEEFKMVRSALPTLLYRKHDAQVSANGGWLSDDWDPNLDSSFIDLAERVLGIRLSGNSVRRAGSSGNGEFLAHTIREEFNAALERKIDELPSVDKFLAKIRMRSMLRRSVLTVSPGE